MKDEVLKIAGVAFIVDDNLKEQKNQVQLPFCEGINRVENPALRT